MKIQIKKSRVLEFKKSVERLNRFAEKNGFDPIQIVSETDLTVVAEKLYFYKDCGKNHFQESVTFKIPAIEFTLTGDVPAFNGWEVVARVTADNEGNVYCDNDLYIPEKMECEHCHTNRNRKETFILKHDDGTIKQVASTCINHFVGKDIGAFFSAIKQAFVSVDDPEKEDDIPVESIDMEHIVFTLQQYVSFTPEQMIAIWEKQNESFVRYFLNTGNVIKGTKSKIYQFIYDAQNEKNKETTHFGTLKERSGVTLTNVKCVGSSESYGKESYEYVAMVGGSPIRFYYKEEFRNTTLKVKATVAKHSEYRNKKTTLLNRVTPLEPLDNDW